MAGERAKHRASGIEVETGLEIATWVERWSDEDRRHAVATCDGDIVEATRSLRTLIGEGLRGHHGTRDLLNACWRFGFLVGSRGGSPTLLSSSMRNAEATWPTASADFGAMCAAANEGFAAARLDQARDTSAAAWGYEGCVVRVDAETIAVACGYPEEDAERANSWADGIAQRAARAGARRAYVSGRANLIASLRDAFDLAGIELCDRPEERPPPGKLSSFFPWNRARRKKTPS